MTLMEPITRNMVVNVDTGPIADFRIRIPESLKERWDETCRRKKIASQDAGAALILFAMDLPDEIQSAVFGQINAQSQQAAARWVIERMANDKIRSGDGTTVRRGGGTVTTKGVSRPIP